MQLQLVQAASDTQQLDEIVNAFTPPMKRVCPHMAEAALREMIERMALQQLADEPAASEAPPAALEGDRLGSSMDRVRPLRRTRRHGRAPGAAARRRDGIGASTGRAWSG